MAGADPSLSMDARQHFLQALRRMLRPIIRMLIRHGIRYHEFADVARGAYVESAVRDGINGVALNSRDEVAVATGIPRQRVDHYIDDEGALATAEPTLTDVVTEVLHRWHTIPSYLDSDGAAVELELDTPSGPSFRRLVAEVSPGADADRVLEEFLRAKSVVYSADNRIRALTRCFIWPEGHISSVEYMGAALANLIQTHEFNFNTANLEGKRLDRSVFADRGLCREFLPDFQRLAMDRANQLLSDLDDWFAQQSDAHANAAGPRAATGVEVYLYVDPPPDQRVLSELIQPRRKLTCTDDGAAR